MAYKVTGACVGIEYLVIGMIENNVYIIDDGTTCFLVDPTSEARRIMNALGNRKPSVIVLTHFHFDHVGAAFELREATGAEVIASAIDAPIIDGTKASGPGHHRFHHCPIDRTVEDGDVVEIGSMKWQVLVTPGHTPGSMCLFLDPASMGGAGVAGAAGTAGAASPAASAPAAGAPVLISGDTLFAGAHGRTDFEEGSPRQMRESILRLADLPENTVVLPGHNNITTIGQELWWLKRGGL